MLLATRLLALSPALRISPCCRGGSVACLTQGDEIRVVGDVVVRGSSAKGRTGKILKVWGEGDDASDDWGACCELAWGEPTLTVALNPPPAPPPTLGYFAFAELRLVERDAKVVAAFEESERRRRQAVLDESEGGPPLVLGARPELLEGDVVEVVDDVPVKGIPNSRGMRGVVTDVWVLCETDPACCCAELATDAPVTVRLDPSLADGEATAPDSEPCIGRFCEDEVELMR